MNTGWLGEVYSNVRYVGEDWWGTIMAGVGGSAPCRSFHSYLIFGPSRSCAIVSTLEYANGKACCRTLLIGLTWNEALKDSFSFTAFANFSTLPFIVLSTCLIDLVYLFC